MPAFSLSLICLFGFHIFGLSLGLPLRREGRHGYRALNRQCPSRESLKLNLSEDEDGGKGQCSNMPEGSIFLPWSKVFIKITRL